MKIRPYKGRRDNALYIFLLVLFFLITIPAAAAGKLQDGPQLTGYDTTPPSAAEMGAIPASSDEWAGSINQVNNLLFIAPAPAPTTIEDKQYIFDDAIVTMLAQAGWGEGRGLKSITEQAGIFWCILNRVDSDLSYMPDTIERVVTPDQFHGYCSSYPTVDDFGRDLKALAVDVLTRWMMEKDGQADVGRVLPKEYLYFSGDGQHNYFRTEYRGGTRWDWTLPSPYES